MNTIRHMHRLYKLGELSFNEFEAKAYALGVEIIPAGDKAHDGYTEPGIYAIWDYPLNCKGVRR